MIFITVNIICVLLIISVHEYGHMFFARKYGIIPTNFSIGLGPELFGFNNNGTRFSLRPVPFGGYVKFPQVDKSLVSLTKAQRIKVYLGGPLWNLILCNVAAVVAVSIGIMPEQMRELPLLIAFAVAVVGTTILFIIAVPFTLYVIFGLLLNPADNIDKVSGPIGVFSGSAVPESTLIDFGYTGQACIMIWMISMAIGSFNLLPLSILDGGHIFKEFFPEDSRFIKAWGKVTGALLIAIIAYVIIADIVRVF